MGNPLVAFAGKGSVPHAAAGLLGPLGAHAAIEAVSARIPERTTASEAAG